MISWRSLGLKLLVIATAIVLVSAHGHAQSALSSSFNHFATGFPLTGTHSSVDCASCHVNGRFKGTPQQCFACHNGATAVGKPQAHPQTTNLCESCHLTTTGQDAQSTLECVPVRGNPVAK